MVGSRGDGLESVCVCQGFGPETIYLEAFRGVVSGQEAEAETVCSGDLMERKAERGLAECKFEARDCTQVLIEQQRGRAGGATSHERKSWRSSGNKHAEVCLHLLPCTELWLGRYQLVPDQHIHAHVQLLQVSSFDDCLAWGRKKFEEYFHDRVAQLVFTFPEDAVTSTGAPFWSAPKRCPHPLKFDAEDVSQASFIQVSVARV